MTITPRWSAVCLTAALLSLATACGDSSDTSGQDAGQTADAAAAADAEPIPDAATAPDAGESPDTGMPPADAGENEDAGHDAGMTECPIGYTGPSCEDCASGYQDADGDGTCELGCDATGDDALDCGTQGSCEVDLGTGLRGCACNTGWAGAACDECAPGWVLEDEVCEPELDVTTGLRLWYDADAQNVGVNANGEVTSWMSRTDGFLLVSPAGDRPRIDPAAWNGRNAILYDAPDQRLSSTGATDALSGDDYTIFVVAWPSVPDNGRALVATRTGDNYATLLETHTSGYRFVHRSPAAASGGDTVTTANPGLVPQLLRAVRSGANPPQVLALSATDQGPLPGNPDLTVLTTAAVGTSHAFVVGSGPFASFRGHMGEVLVYDRLLTSAELDSVRAYVERKWGF